MTKLEKLIKRFEEIREQYKDDEEVIHGKMDDAMLEYINSLRITELFNADAKWYA